MGAGPSPIELRSTRQEPRAFAVFLLLTGGEHNHAVGACGTVLIIATELDVKVCVEFEASAMHVSPIPSS